MTIEQVRKAIKKKYGNRIKAIAPIDLVADDENLYFDCDLSNPESTPIGQVIDAIVVCVTPEGKVFEVPQEI